MCFKYLFAFGNYYIILYKKRNCFLKFDQLKCLFKSLIVVHYYFFFSFSHLYCLKCTALPWNFPGGQPNSFILIFISTSFYLVCSNVLSNEFSNYSNLYYSARTFLVFSYNSAILSSWLSFPSWIKLFIIRDLRCLEFVYCYFTFLHLIILSSISN